VRVAVFVGPVVASFAVAWVVTGMLPPSSGRSGQALHLGVLLVVSTVVLLVLDRAARRMLPLVTLLDLSLLFPQSAPSRLRVAREAIRRRPIEEQLARVREAGADPSTAATEILSLVAALSSHDRPTRGHAERVRMFTDLIAEQMKLPERDRDLLRWAAILHDIGKLRVPTTLLNKAGKPDKAEWATLQAHPAHGAEIAGALLPWLGEWGQVIVEHHERWDGTGYPNGLAGREIHLGSRIVSVADAYDVMTSARAYQRPVSRAAAYQELVRFSGTQFDPAAVRAMVAVSAPRLRRAQGLLAWLADIPLVATHVVPAATLARVVGAGAIATGVVAGGGVLAPTPAPATTQVAGPPVSRSTSDERPSAAAGTGVTSAPSGPRERPSGAVQEKPTPGTAAPSRDSGAVGSVATPRPSTTASTSSGGSGSGGSGSSGSGSGSTSSGSGSSGSGSSGSGSSGSGSGGSGSTPSPSATDDGDDQGDSDSLGDTVDDIVDDLTDTVDDVTDDVEDTTGSLVGGLLGP
jgi:putative nucleotidyltransferase with HDIG domain